jgi:hypothetical protein
MKAVVIFALAASACGNDLPPLVLTTPHVRYHARSPDDLPDGASAWIEDFRADLLTYFGVVDSQRDTVIDYYLFRDNGDLVTNSPCPGVACTSGASPAAVYTTRPLDDYELVHGFLNSIGGAAPYMIAEGAARNVSCYPEELSSNIVLPSTPVPQPASGSRISVFVSFPYSAGSARALTWDGLSVTSHWTGRMCPVPSEPRYWGSELAWSS